MDTAQKIRLSAETGFCLITICKWDRGMKISRSAESALTAVAERLGIFEDRGKVRMRKAKGEGK